MVLSALAMGVACSGPACSGNPAGPSPPLSGTWGGDHVSLTVTASGEHLEFDCAEGDIPGPLVVDTRSAFSASGTFTREHGGPIRVGELPDRHPAIYTGSVTGPAMVLQIRLTDTGEAIGTFTLTRGAAGRVFKCL
jgi:hypothetical protein